MGINTSDAMHDRLLIAAWMRYAVRAPELPNASAPITGPRLQEEMRGRTTCVMQASEQAVL
jgi:hypothetical protein